jgi:uncharacterized coiled-coil DUF342 family protein
VSKPKQIGMGCVRKMVCKGGRKMSDTPETDAAWDKYINPYTYSAGDLRILAERLERERDEWAAMCGRYKQERDIAEADATNFHARIFELINERDEAREQLRKASVEANTLATSIQKTEYPDAKEFELLGSVAGVISQIDNMYAGVRQQRDEWRKKYKLSVDAVEIAARLARAESERDEARKETNNHYVNYLGARYMANELADIASKYLSFLLAATPIKANETHEKETMKVIDALKRWKEL